MIAAAFTRTASLNTSATRTNDEFSEPRYTSWNFITLVLGVEQHHAQGLLVKRAISSRRIGTRSEGERTCSVLPVGQAGSDDPVQARLSIGRLWPRPAMYLAHSEKDTRPTLPPSIKLQQAVCQVNYAPPACVPVRRIIASNSASESTPLPAP